MSYLKEIVLNSFQELVFRRSGLNIDSLKMLKADASERKIFRIYYGGLKCIGIFNENPKENLAFVKFSESFLKLGFNVPEIYGFSDDNLFYIEEDLGDMTLKSAVSEKDSEEKIHLYKKALNDLIRFQVLSKDKLDYSYCYQTKCFDESVLKDDFGKFHDYLLKNYLTGFDKDNLLEKVMMFCSDLIRDSDNDFFLYRDFQPRNIMLKNNELYYIDYQSGRKGPLQYDLASFIYSGSAELTRDERFMLMIHYEENLRNYINYNEQKFRKDFYYFAFIRLIQVLGSYAYVYERRKDQKMTEKIKQGLLKLEELNNNLENKDINRFINNLTSHCSEFIRI